MSPPETYDYVIAGGGTAGCVLAARLAEKSGTTVLLVEDGGSGRGLFVDMPAGGGFLFGNPEYDWGFESVPQLHLGGRRIYYPRGRGLGGTSLINGMIHVRGFPADFDRWEAMGLEGWSFGDVLPYYRRSEHVPHRNGVFHGQGGPLELSVAGNFDPINQRFVAAAIASGVPWTDDFNGAHPVGVGRFDVAVARGRRMSVRQAYLRRPPANLRVLTRHRALRLQFEGRRACGLVLRGPDGVVHFARAAREVLVCLGAFGSPNLLMRSGIGPAAHLRDRAIEVICDLPGVGASLCDHPNMPVRFNLREPSLSFARFQRADRALAMGLRYLLCRSGPGAAPFWSSGLFHRLSSEALPDLEIFFTPMAVDEGPSDAAGRRGSGMHFGRRVVARGKLALPGVQFDINLLRPASRGTVRLADNPEGSPIIDPALCSAESDIAQLRSGLALVARLVAQPGLAEVLGSELLIDGMPDDGAEDIHARVTTGHHPVSTCRMGPMSDPMAVLDAQFRLRGVEGVRVVDASAFADQISANPTATVVMMAERAADMVIGRTAPETDDPRKVKA